MADAVHLAALIVKLKARQLQLAGYPFDRVQVGEKSYAINEARETIDKQLAEAEEQLASLSAGGKGFSVGRVQSPTL